MLWTKEKPKTPEFIAMMNDVNDIITHLCNLINQGPEVKENSAKRVMVARAIMKTLLTHSFVTAIDRLGILESIKDDLNSEQRVQMFKDAVQSQMESYEKSQPQRPKKDDRLYVS